MVGKILEAAKVTNELTSRDFLRVQMETPAGPMDLIVDPGMLEEPPDIGQIIQAGAWISGRITPEEDEK
jgi:hypothetical protein